jgi:internalin A
MAKDNALQAAEKKIAEALRERKSEVSLNGSWIPGASDKLTELPESLFQLTQLRSLNLANNKLTALPESLGQLTQLQSLNLSKNELAELPESLGQLTQLQSLDLSSNQLTALPESLVQLTQLQSLKIDQNRLTVLPESLGQLTQLQSLGLTYNELTSLPESLGQLTKLPSLMLVGNQLTTLPESLGQLTQLETLNVVGNKLTELPASLGQLAELLHLMLSHNPLNPELAVAFNEGFDAVKRYLRAKAEAQVVLNEAKLILIGEGEVGKSCLLGALRGDPWEEGKPTTHGIEIKPVIVSDPSNSTEITLNGWDFGGQRVYRPTHQLFFTSPAVYLVVWKPREGPQQGFVKEWIKLVKHREPAAKILVVATHGGPKERQPDIDRQEIWDLFGKETVVDFFLVQSKPDEATGERHGIAELRDAIARVAAGLPEMGRTFPQHWQEARLTLRGLLSLDVVLALLGPLVHEAEEARSRLQQLGENRLCLESAIRELGDLVLDENKARDELSKARVAYLPLDRVFAICKEHKVEEDDARLLLRISRAVGDLIHFEHDPTLRDIVVLKPDWLATAMSFVLDDEQTRQVGHGLVSFARLGLLWNNPDKAAQDRYPAELHPIFLRLMERFDLCYRVAEPGKADGDGTNLIAQLVPDVRPVPVPGWPASSAAGDEQQVQVCRIVEAAKNQSATAEGIFYQLIVRLHKYSMGRADYAKSVHWQRGLVLQDNYGARAFLEHFANDIRITVRSPYPERFLAALTYEVKWLVESFWEGLRCEVTVPCLVLQPDGKPCIGLFEVGKLLENKRRGRPEQPCPVCNEWQDIEQLLHNAPASRPNPLDQLLSEFAAVRVEVAGARRQLIALQGEAMDCLEKLDAGTQRILSRVDDGFTELMQALTDEAKEGPRLFSFQPVAPGFFDRPRWINQKFRLTLWCEHSRLPLPELNDKDSNAGVYELNLPREWFEQAAPFLKVLTGTLSLVLPVAASATKFLMDDTAVRCQLSCPVGVNYLGR